MAAYYNEFDPTAAQWLRNLISAGLIAPGDVDDRSIIDVSPDDLRGYTQCHFFAGVGVWSYALRRAGWDDSRPVWTGSCPCQPFSTAGAGAGFADERHLWPAFHWLISECGPAAIFGEQVASKAAESWVDLVQADVEALGYAFGAIPFPAAGVGAPNIRDRLYWVAHAKGKLRSRDVQVQGRESSASGKRESPGGCSKPGRVANPSGKGLEKRIRDTRVASGTIGARQGKAAERAGLHDTGRVADSSREGLSHRGPGATQPITTSPHRNDSFASGPAGPVNGFWGGADWLGCRDGRFRPVEPGTFPLANGAPARVGRLRAYGNAINAEAAVQFIGAFLDADSEKGPANLSPLDELI